MTLDEQTYLSIICGNDPISCWRCFLQIPLISCYNVECQQSVKRASVSSGLQKIPNSITSNDKKMVQSPPVLINIKITYPIYYVHTNLIFNTIKNYYAKRRFALDICNGQLVLSSNKNNKESASSKKFKGKRKKNIFSVDFDPLVKWNDSLKIQFDSNHYIQCPIHTGWGLFFSFFFQKSRFTAIQLKEYYWQLPNKAQWRIANMQIKMVEMSGIFVIFLLINAEQQVKTGKHTSYFVTNPKSSTYQKYR